MKLKLQCDNCGKVGTAEEITASTDERDLCIACAAAEDLANMKQRYASKMEWLESTHLKELRELKQRIDAAEASLANNQLSNGGNGTE